MKLSILSFFGAVAGVCPASAFVPPQTHTNNGPHLQAVDTVMAVEPTYVIASVGAAVSAIAGAAIAFGRKVAGDAAVTTKSELVAPEPEVIDVSIPYDAAAMLSYNVYGKSSSTKVDFDQFKSLYYEQMVAEVKATVQARKVNKMKSVLATLESDANAIKSQIDALFGDSSAVSTAPSVSQIAADSAASKNSADLSIDYNGAAKLAYAFSDKTMDFDSFRKVYEAETVAMVAAKNPYKK
ncbi:hypothetical protein ACHAWO_010668 [Cyclotella atomus]|uniref:Uncharacterized protein n=1 Tax=Cyclotella atomus TaxID=382360 RepID=A0ABD3PTB6_9STRA